MRPRTKAAWLAIIVLACLVRPLQAAVPDWMRQAMAQPPATYPPDTKAIVLLDATDNTITGPGECVEHYRRVVKILRPDGRDEGDLGVYLEHQEKLLSLHAWSVDSSGHEYELKDKDFIEKSPYADDFYSDIRYRMATVPASAPGSVIALEYEVRRHAWINQLDWIFQEENPVREAQFSVQLPSGWECKAARVEAGSVRPVEAANGCSWTVRDVPAIEDEPRRPSLLALSGRMAVAFFGPGQSSAASWDALGKWYADLTADRRNITPEISSRVEQLLAGKTDFDSKLRALASFVQSDVRYVAIEIGIGGFQPHAAGDVLHHGYGDCKDKATLLSTMLKAAGIRSDYVLIDHRRNVVKPDLPSAFFDHAILAIELPAGTDGSYRSVLTAKNGQRYLIFDPTDEYTPVGELRAALQDSYALLVNDSGGELIRTPQLPPEANILTRDGHFTLNADGTLAGEVVETRTGNHAAYERSILLRATEKERSQHLERELNESLKGFTLQNTDIQQLGEFHKDLVLTLKFSTPQYGQIRGPLMLVRPRVLEEKSFEVTTKPRHYPFVLGAASQEVDTYEIELPPEYKVDDVPDPVKIDAGFASYQSKVEVSGSRLRYWREYVVRDLRVPADHVPDLRRFEGSVGADEQAAVVLKHAP